MDNDRKYFLPYQYDWITDPRPLKIAEKSRQIGITFADAYHSVRIASNKGARYDVFVSSRDKFQAKLYIEDCKNWGQVLEILTIDRRDRLRSAAQRFSLRDPVFQWPAHLFPLVASRCPGWQTRSRQAR